MKPGRLETWLCVTIPIVAAAALYLPVLDHGFVWDDDYFLQDLPTYRGASHWLESLSRPFTLSANYFRPLTLLTFLAQAGGADPAPFPLHLANLSLHLVNVALVTLLAMAFTRPAPTMASANRLSEEAPARCAALVAGLWYGLHPALVEGVSFVSGRFDLLTTTFVLLALLADLRVSHRVLRPLLVALAFLLAALAKEMAIVLVAVLPIWRLARSEPQGHHRVGREELAILVATGAAGLLYLGLRVAALGHLFSPGSSHALPAGNGLQHLLLVGRSIAEYLRLTFWPFGALTPIHFSVLPVATNDPTAWAQLALVCASCAGIALWVLRSPGTGWLAAAALVALAPVANIMPLDLSGGAFVAERFLTLPLALAAVVIAAVSSRLFTGARGRLPGRFMFSRAGVAICALLVWIAAAAFTAHRVLPHWRDDLMLWTWVREIEPRSPTSHINLAIEHCIRGDAAAALVSARAALALNPDDGIALYAMGRSLIGLQRFVEAQGYLENAALATPSSAPIWNSLAIALREQGKLHEAELVLRERTLVRDPDYPWAYLDLGLVHLAQGRPDLAGPALETALRLLPDYEKPNALQHLSKVREPGRWLQLGKYFLTQGSRGEAKRAFETAAAFGASPAQVAFAQGQLLQSEGRTRGAAALFRRAVELDPALTEARTHLEDLNDGDGNGLPH